MDRRWWTEAAFLCGLAAGAAVRTMLLEPVAATPLPLSHVPAAQSMEHPRNAQLMRRPRFQRCFYHVGQRLLGLLHVYGSDVMGWGYVMTAVGGMAAVGMRSAGSGWWLSRELLMPCCPLPHSRYHSPLSFIPPRPMIVVT